MKPTVVIMKAPKHLLNATKVTTCRSGVETFHVKSLSGFIAVKSLTRIIFFITMTLPMKERHCFILRSYLATIFLS